MLGSSPNLIWAWFSTRGIQKSGSQDPKTHPSAYADRQTPKIKNGPLDLKTGIDKVQDPRNPKIVVPRPKNNPSTYADRQTPKTRNGPLNPKPDKNKSSGSGDPEKRCPSPEGGSHHPALPSFTRPDPTHTEKREQFQENRWFVPRFEALEAQTF